MMDKLNSGFGKDIYGLVGGASPQEKIPHRPLNPPTNDDLLSLNATHSVSGGSDTSVYVQYVNTKIWQEVLAKSFVKGISRNEIEDLHETFDVIFLDFYSMLIHPPPGFVKLMGDLGFSDVDCVDDGFRVLMCRGGKNVYVPNLLHVGRFSPFRKWRNVAPSLSRFVNKLFRLRDLGVDYLVEFDLTVPGEVSLSWSNDVDEGVRLLKSAFKLFVRCLESKFNGRLGYFFNVHVWGTRSLKPHFHIHSCFCNAVMKEDGKLIRFRPFFDVDFIRQIWKESLRGVGLRVDGNVDVKVRYVKLSNRAGVVHRVKYASRHPLIDIASYFVDRDYEGLSDGLRDWFLKLIYYVNRRICGGFLRKLSKLVGDVEVKRVCPVCGDDCGDGGTVGFNEVDDLAKQFVEGILVIIFWDLRERRYKLVYSEKWLGLLKWFGSGDNG
jgi:hypothetical protein